MRSIKVKLTLIFSALSLLLLFLILTVFYLAATAGIYSGAKNRADVLSDEFAYSLEILAAQDNFFNTQRLVEKSSVLEGVVVIFVVDTRNQVLAHTNKQTVGQTFTSPLITQAVKENEKVSNSEDGHLIIVTPLHGTTYNDEYHNVIAALWIEIDVTPSVDFTQRVFLEVTFASIFVFMVLFTGYYLSVKSIIIDRLQDMETGIARQLEDKSLSVLNIKPSFGGEDEINSLANKYNFLAASLHDSQDKLKTERDFALQVMESMREGLTLTNAAGLFEYVNPAYAGFLGLAPAQIIGHSPADFTHPDDQLKNAGQVKARKSGESSSYEVRLISRDGAEVYVLISAAPRFVNGQFAGSIAVVTNISQRSRLEQMKSDFINRASHELRTPLTTAILMANLLESGTDEEKRQFLTVLKQQLDRQRLLLNDLLVAGRIESRNFNIHLSTINIIPAIREAIDSVKPQADARQIQFQFEADPLTPPSLTDAQALLQVLLNLLSNAIKFSHPDGLVLVGVQHEGRSIRISVRDYGMGIPAQDLAHISDRFFRAQNATQMEIPGTGIGLYIVKEIMESLGGHLQIESVEGQGTTATVTIPAAGDVPS